MHFDDSVESTADSDLEDAELQKMRTSPLYAQKASEKPDAMVMQERERESERGQCTMHSSRSKKIVWGLFHLKVRKLRGNPMHCFHLNKENQIRSSAFGNANPSNLRGSLLESNKDHLLDQARSDLAKQELHVESLNKCIGELQRQTEQQRLALQDAQYDLLNLDENKIDYKKNCLWKKKFSKILKSEIRTKWEKLRERKNFE